MTRTLGPYELGMTSQPAYLRDVPTMPDFVCYLDIDWTVGLQLHLKCLSR
jgi:hypothetical protein